MIVYLQFFRKVYPNADGSFTMNIQQEICPRCGLERLRAWSELSVEEREVVRRLAASADYPLAERMARHLWCRRCWHEATTDVPHDV